MRRGERKGGDGAHGVACEGIPIMAQSGIPISRPYARNHVRQRRPRPRLARPADPVPRATAARRHRSARPGRATSRCAMACGWRIDVYLPEGAGHGRAPTDRRGVHPLLPPLQVHGARAPSHRRTSPSIATSSCRAATRWSWWTCAAAARASARATASARRANATTIARSPTGSSAQPWSSGAIGSTGISYLGAAACFLASTGHPAVKAIAPLFAVHDTYADHLFPGGIKCTTVTENYDELVRALDLDQRDQLAPYPYFNDPRYAGPQPVDDDTDGTRRARAVDAHRDSFRLRDLAPEIAFREEATSHDPAPSQRRLQPVLVPGAGPGPGRTSTRSRAGTTAAASSTARSRAS